MPLSSSTRRSACFVILVDDATYRGCTYVQLALDMSVAMMALLAIPVSSAAAAVHSDANT